MRQCIRDVNKFYRSGSRAVDGISLQVGTGQFRAIQGPRGCGQATLLLLADGLLAPDSGTVAIDGQNLYLLTNDNRARFRNVCMGFVSQQCYLKRYLSVLKNVLSPSAAGRLEQKAVPSICSGVLALNLESTNVRRS